jgi:quercetin dioxygenase-like cupin family protein
MKVTHIDDVAATPGKTFTGEVAMRRIFELDNPQGMGVSLVRFEDGARTNWHQHAGEQILIIVEGEGRAGNGTEEHLNLRPGTVLHMPANERHWHGAMPGKSMAHYSITNIGPATWFEAPEE